MAAKKSSYYSSFAAVVILFSCVLSCHALVIQKSDFRIINFGENRDTAKRRRTHTRLRRRQRLLHRSSSDDSTSTVNTSESFSDSYNNNLPLFEYFRSLPGPPGPTSDDDFTRWLKRTFPVEFQFWLRDSGVLRALMDGLVVLGVPTLLKTYPNALPRFLRLSGVNYSYSSSSGVSTRLASIFARTEAVVDEELLTQTRFETIQYGPHPLQTIDILSSNSHTTAPSRIVLFCHGGAWGSGRPWMYRLIADMFLKESAGTTCCLWGYRTYPDGKITEQLEDLEGALTELSRRYPNTPITILAHSSGAHVCLLRVLEWIKQESKRSDRLLSSIESMILMSGVYDIKAHEQWEATRGVDLLSPMQPTCGGDTERCARYSPTKIVQQSKNELLDQLPPLWLIHGLNDTVVPYTSTVKLAEALHLEGRTSEMSKDDKLQVDILPDCSHVDPMLQLMMGGPLQQRGLEWIKQ